MRTNIVINDNLMQEAMALSGLTTKRAVVDEALKLFVQMQRQAEIRKLRGKIEWVGNLDEMREARFIDAISFSDEEPELEGAIMDVAS